MKKSSINRLIVLLHAMNYFASLGIFMHQGCWTQRYKQYHCLTLTFFHYHITEEQSSTQFLFLGWQCVCGGGGGGGIGEWGSMVRALDFLSGGPSRNKTKFLESWAYLFLLFLIDCSMPLWMFIMCRCLLLWFVLDYSSVLCFHPSFHFYRQMFQGYKNFSGVW